MGIINRDPSFDDEYSREIIARARDLSPEIDEYIVTQRYLVETQEENLRPEWLRNRVLTMIIEQIGAAGIFVNQSTDAILDQPLFIEAVLTLRAKFDKDRLFKLLIKHQEIRDSISEILDDDCIEDVISVCNKCLPLDEGWENLANLLEDRPDMLRSTGVFNEMISDTLERCDRLGDNPMFADDDTNKMLEYAQYLADRKNNIINIASIIYSSDEAGKQLQGKVDIITNALVNFERQLSSPQTLRQYIDGEFSPKSFVEKIRSFYLSKWRHCIEFYLAQDVDDVTQPKFYPSDMEAAVMVATLYVDAPDKTHARVFVVETFENAADQFGDRYPKFRELIDKALGNLVIVEGEVNYEVI